MLTQLAPFFLQMGPYSNDHDHMGWDDGWGISMFVTMALFWLGVLTLGAWAIHRLTAHRPSHAEGSGQPGRPDPLSIARERLARGEISVEQFEEIRKHLL